MNSSLLKINVYNRVNFCASILSIAIKNPELIGNVIKLNGISTLEDYLVPNPIYIYIYNL